MLCVASGDRELTWPPPDFAPAHGSCSAIFGLRQLGMHSTASDRHSLAGIRPGRGLLAVSCPLGSSQEGRGQC